MSALPSVDHDRLPNFFVVGAAKAATTTLHAVLSQHPDVYCPPLKEPGFFADATAPGKFDPFSGRPPFDGVTYVRGPMAHHEQIAFITNDEIYRQLYRRVGGEKAIGDFSTAYLCSTDAARRIQAFNPAARIIMILREPADRALSHYKMDRGISLVSRPFRRVIAEELHAIANPGAPAHWYIRLGLYADQVERYLEAFPADQVKVALFEDFAERRAQLIAEIEDHLGIARRVGHVDLVVNKSLMPRNQLLIDLIEKSNIRPLVRRTVPKPLINRARQMLFRPYADAGSPVANAADLARIRDVCAEDVRKLASLLGRDLSHWLSP